MRNSFSAGMCTVALLRPPAPFGRAVRCAEQPALSGAALRHHQGQGLSAGFEAGHAPAVGGDGRHRQQQGRADFDNTIVAMERSGRMLERVNNAFFRVVQANTNPALDKVQTAVAPKLAAHTMPSTSTKNCSHASKRLRLAASDQKLDSEGVASADALLPPVRPCRRQSSQKDKTRLKEINKRDAAWTASFQQKLVAAAKKGGLGAGAVRSSSKGLSDCEVAAGGGSRQSHAG
jgi:Zn-dependent oligopeptidase